MPLKKIHLLRGISQYDIFSGWLEGLRSGFQRRGIDAEMVSIYEDYGCKSVEGVVSLGFNLIRCWEPEMALRPHFLWCVDHPAYCSNYFFKKYQEPDYAGGTVPLVVDRSRRQFASEAYRVVQAGFLPHATALACDTTPHAERPLEAVFLGTLDSVENCRRLVMREVERHVPEMWPVCVDILDDYPFVSDSPLDRFFWNVLRNVLGLPEEQAIGIFSVLFPSIDRYFRMKHRIAFLKSLKRCRLHIYGNGPWRELGLGDQVELHGPIDHRDVPELFRHTRVVLNHAPTLRDGSHERVMDALACGCRVVSTPSLYLGEEFMEAGGLSFCRAGEESQLDELVLQSAPSVEAAQQHVMQHHTMDARAGQLLHLIYSLKMVNEGMPVCS